MVLSVKDIFVEAARFYRASFKKMAPFSFVIFLCSTLFVGFIFGSTLLKPSNPFFGASMALIMAMIVISIAVLPKLNLALYIQIDRTMDGRSLSFGEAYHETDGKYWLMIGYSLLIGLWMVVPVMIMAPFSFAYKNLVMTALGAFVYALYYFVIPMIAIEPKTGKYIRRAIALQKGNYLKILLLQFITSTLLSLLYQFVPPITIGGAQMFFLFNFVYFFINFLLLPYSATVAVTAYRKFVRQEN